MSDQEACYIGPDSEGEDGIYPSFNNTAETIKAAEDKPFIVQIKEFQILKEAYIVQTETQIYKVEIFVDEQLYKTIHRRFSDFEFLFDIIQERYPGLIIPGFQQKTLFSYFEAKITYLQKSLIDIRMIFLCRFLTKILNIGVLRQSREIQSFLGSDTEFQIFKKSNLANIKKKGFIGNFLTTAGNIFKTKKVDSKYQKFLDEGMVVLKQLEKIEQEFSKYPQSLLEEVSANQELKQTNPEIFQVQTCSKMFQLQNKLSSQYGQSMQNTVNELLYCQLDVKFYLSIIQKRYEFKQNGDYKNVDILQKTFVSQKDGFLQSIRTQLDEVRNQLKGQIAQYNAKSKQIWKP